LRKWNDALLVAAVADVREELVVNLREAVLEAEAAVTFGVVLLGPELERAKPRVDAEDLRFVEAGGDGFVGQADGAATFPRADFDDELGFHGVDEFVKRG
jgi:hypothetical protein